LDVAVSTSVIEDAHNENELFREIDRVPLQGYDRRARAVDGDAVHHRDIAEVSVPIHSRKPQAQPVTEAMCPTA
jgi:hypothetical protein